MRLFGRRERRTLRTSTYSNSSVIERIERDAGVDRETATAWFRELLVFLDIVAESRDFVSPPRPVDVAWHAFILHTRDYESYCRERYGRVIHHEPTGIADEAAYRRAYERRQGRFGGADQAIWAAPVGAGAVAGLGDDAGDDPPDGGDAGSSGGSGGSGDASGGSSWGGGDAGGGSSCGGGGCGGGGG